MKSRIVGVLAKNFKGRSFEYAIENRLLILGPNGSGKSAIVQAIQLAIDGFVPGINRTNPVILETLGSDPSLYVEVAVEHPSAGVIRLGRQFVRDKSTVKEVLLVDRRKVDARAFGFAVGQCQCPKTIAVDDFLSMSAQKFMVFLGSKVESAASLNEASATIDKTKEDVNRLTRQLAESTSFIAKASENVARLNLPPGSLADVQNEIKEREAELVEATATLARLQDEERQRLQDEERQRLEKEQRESALLKNPVGRLPAEPPPVQLRTPGPIITGITPPAAARYPESPVLEPDLTEGEPPTLAEIREHSQRNVKRIQDATFEGAALMASAARSIRAIIDAINDVACPTCHGGGALLVAKGELRKWEGRQ